jgi:hypothetical protein
MYFMNILVVWLPCLFPLNLSMFKNMCFISTPIMLHDKIQEALSLYHYIFWSLVSRCPKATDDTPATLDIKYLIKIIDTMQTRLCV